MNKMASDLLIGDLLRGAGIVSLPDLSNAVQVAGKTGLPVGRVLVMLGLVTSEVVQAALNAQSLVRDRHITLDVGKRALCMVSSTRVTLDEALADLNMAPASDLPSNKLGDLLVSTELITAEQLADALSASQHLGLPLGRILVLKNFLADDQVESALEAQVLLRDGRISRLQALEALRTMRMCGSDLIESLKQLGCERAAERNTVRIGELFILAELVSESDLLTAVEIGLVENVQLGRILIEFGFISEDVLDSALRLQKMVGNDHVSVTQAVAALKIYANGSISLIQAIVDVMDPRVSEEEVESLLQLLQCAGLISAEEFDRLLRFRDTSIFEVVLASTGLMNETTLSIALQCHTLMKENFLTCEQAIVALHHWRWTGISLTDILINLGWTAGRQMDVVPSILKWEATGSRKDEEERQAALLNQAAGTPTILVTNSLANFEWGCPEVTRSRY